MITGADVASESEAFDTTGLPIEVMKMMAEHEKQLRNLPAMSRQKIQRGLATRITSTTDDSIMITTIRPRRKVRGDL